MVYSRECQALEACLEMIDCSSSAEHVSTLETMTPVTEEARSLFNQSVKSIYIEISESCNRKCIFCPNHDQLRYANNATKTFDLPKYKQLREELGEIGYSGSFGYHLYNEPLLDYEHFMDCLRLSRENIPLARLTLNTNGDRLDSNRLEEIISQGICRIHVSL